MFTLSHLTRLSNSQTRSISPENPTGERGNGARDSRGVNLPGAASELGVGWKVSPYITLPAKSTITLADIPHGGVIQHFWITVAKGWGRKLILRCYWDNEDLPSVEVPLGDFFCSGWDEDCLVTSLPVVVNPKRGYNSYWQMPFCTSAYITLENLTPIDLPSVYFQITYSPTKPPSESTAYFHATWQRSNPVEAGTVHTILDHVSGQGHYVGTYLAWGINHNGWWGEGEVKMYIDDDQQYPSICYTGTEDYFGGAWCFEAENEVGYKAYSTAFLGLPQIIQPNGFKQSQMRFGMYRWHIPDPVHFQNRLHITVQDLGWRSENRFMFRQDDIASTAFWYQTEPHQPFDALPHRNDIEVK